MTTDRKLTLHYLNDLDIHLGYIYTLYCHQSAQQIQRRILQLVPAIFYSHPDEAQI